MAFIKKLISKSSSSFARNALSPSQKKYTTALMRGVPKSLPNALAMGTPTEPISFQKAVDQHNSYREYLECMLPRVIELKPDESFPDCVFVEDTAVVVDDKAVITNIGADSRKGEVDAVQDMMEKIGLKITDMREVDKNATCDGGDVLYPVSYRRDGPGPLQKFGGKHLFVGLSSRTNQAGASVLQQAFPDVEVVAVDLDGMTSTKALHLKSIVTHLDENTLLIPKGEEWGKLIDRMGLNERGYEVVRLPDLTACNVVSVNGKVIAQPNIGQESMSILMDEVEKRGMMLVWVDASEYTKCDGALTCKSVLIP